MNKYGDDQGVVLISEGNMFFDQLYIESFQFRDIESFVIFFYSSFYDDFLFIVVDLEQIDLFRVGEVSDSPLEVLQIIFSQENGLNRSLNTLLLAFRRIYSFPLSQNYPIQYYHLASLIWLGFFTRLDMISWVFMSYSSIVYLPSGQQQANLLFPPMIIEVTDGKSLFFCIQIVSNYNKIQKSHQMKQNIPIYQQSINLKTSMSSGSYLSTGFLYINLGCHMIFVLKNRLQAQGIPHDKIIKILCDLINSIFKISFINTILIPQEPMTLQTLKEVFRKLAHTSIMKLDHSSMEKLLYLIIMTVKKEIFLLSSPLEIFSLTSGNLQILLDYTKNTEAEDSMGQILKNFRETGSTYRFMQYLQLRQFLLCLFEPFQTKVVNFYENNTQNEIGKLIFTIRNAHNDKLIGTGIHQANINISASKSISKEYLSLQSWKSWKTSLVIDHADSYTKQTEKRNAKKEKQVESNQKNLNDLFKIEFDGANDFQVKLQFLNYEDNGSNKLNKQKDANSKPDKSKTSVEPQKEAYQKQSSKIAQKIASQFKEVINQDENQDDLLDLMDN